MRPDSLTSVDDVGRRRAQGVGDELDLVVAQGGLEQRRARGLGPAHHPGAALALGGLGDAVLVQQPAGEASVVVGHHRLELRLELHRVELAHALVLAGDDDVDAVGVVADVLVEPLQLDLELLGREADGAEHADAAGVGDGGHHVAAVGEGEDRELDPEAVADLGVHGCLLSVSVGCGRRTVVVSGLRRSRTAAGAGVAPVTSASAEADHGGVEAIGVDAMLRLEAEDHGPERRGQVVGRARSAAPSPSSIQVAKPRVIRSCDSRRRARRAAATSGSRAARSHSSCSSSRSRRVCSLGFGDHVGGHGPQAVLDAGGQLELGGDAP